MSSFDELKKNENFIQLLQQVPDKERKEIENSISSLLEKFDINLELLLKSIEKTTES